MREHDHSDALNGGAIPGIGAPAAADVSIVDTAGYFLATEVESALAETYSDLEAHDHDGDYEAAGSIATHAAIADAHHAKYTDAEAIAAVEGEPTLVLTGAVTLGVVNCETISPDFALACKLAQTSDQTVSNATDTTATWDVAAYDQGTNWSLSAMADLANERIYARKRGLYDLKVQYAFDPSTSGGRVARIYHYDVSAATAILVAEHESRSEAGARDGVAHACVDYVVDTADDYFYVEIFQNSGGNLNSVPAKCWFSARWICDYIT
jgi:hypothetical protein